MIWPSKQAYTLRMHIRTGVLDPYLHKEEWESAVQAIYDFEREAEAKARDAETTSSTPETSTFDEGQE